MNTKTKALFALLLSLTTAFAAACSDPSDSSGSTSEDNSSGGTSVEGASYTYRAAVSNSPTTWNPHAWENNNDSIILGYTTMGFYDVQLNEEKNGYEFVCEMASEFPVDVTSQYVGKYGVESGETGKVWKISLNRNAKWDDGTAINADDYIYSMKEQLNPKMLNRRSDSYTSGALSVYGAKNYLYSTTVSTYEIVYSQGYSSSQEAIDAGKELYIDCWNFWNASGYEDENGNKCPQYVSIEDETVYDTADAWAEGEAEDSFSGASLWATYRAYLEAGADYQNYLFITVDNDHLGYGYEGDGTDPNSGVGVFKTGDYEITIALNAAIDDFNIKYNLGSNWLVKEELYEECKVEVNENLITSTYCTTLEKTASYGPYSLKAYVPDQYFNLEKNENWYGYKDGKHVGQYQTTAIDYTVISGEAAKATTREKFMKGELDDYSVDGTEMADFGSSSYLISEPESYTYQFFMNSNLTKLQAKDDESKKENHSVLSLANFRKAISFAISRTNYCSRFDPASQPGFGVLNSMYCIDPASGEVYRDTEAAKKVSLVYAGFTEGSDGKWTDHKGEEYESLDDAYEAITGYDVEYAKDLFKAAYDEAKAAGIYTDGWDVVINMGGVGTPSANRTAMLAMFNEMIAAAVPENTFKSVKIANEEFATEEQYWAALKSGEMDLSFSAWGGSAMDPWGIIYSCYIDPANSNNYGFDSLAKTIDVTIDGNTFTLYDWASWMNNNQEDGDYTSAENNLYKKLGLFSDKDTDYKVKVLAACELAQLQTTVNIPIFYSYTNSLKSAKYNNGVDTYLQLIGFGGIRHVTYNYTDAEWDAFVANNGGNLESLYKG